MVLYVKKLTGLGLTHHASRHPSHFSILSLPAPGRFPSNRYDRCRECRGRTRRHAGAPGACPPCESPPPGFFLYIHVERIELDFQRRAGYVIDHLQRLVAGVDKISFETI